MYACNVVVVCPESKERTRRALQQKDLQAGRPHPSPLVLPALLGIPRHPHRRNPHHHRHRMPHHRQSRRWRLPQPASAASASRRQPQADSPVVTTCHGQCRCPLSKWRQPGQTCQVATNSWSSSACKGGGRSLGDRLGHLAGGSACWWARAKRRWRPLLPVLVLTLMMKNERVGFMCTAIWTDVKIRYLFLVHRGHKCPSGFFSCASM